VALAAIFAARRSLPRIISVLSILEPDLANLQGGDSEDRFLRGKAGDETMTKEEAASPLVRFRARLAEQPAWQSGEHRIDALPQRYDNRPGDDEQTGYLRCREAPGIRVFLDRKFAFSEAEARKLGERVILLDGAGQFAPVMDSKPQFYNLDHHQDCLRAFTLATCEQALVLIAKGLQLDQGDWSVYANEPDLDTLFALWVLLNYRRLLALAPERRDIIAPLLRLEGAIDANGLEVAEFCGLPQGVLATARETLDRLHRRELDLKQSGDWASVDLGAYTVEMLGEIDKLVYERGDFEDFASVEEEYGHVEIGDNRAAVICRDSAGVYEVEKRLKSLWGDRLGIIALEKESGQYTLRRSASLAAIDLNAAYDRLNLLDPSVNGRPPSRRWGGSDDIGGSPRPGGTGLQPREIGAALWQAYRRKGWVEKLKQAIFSLLLSAGIVALAGLVAIILQLVGGPLETATEGARRLAAMAVAAAVLAGLLTFQFAHRRKAWLFGWRRPGGKDWLAVAPVALVGALLCGAWLPLASITPGDWSTATRLGVLGALALWALAIELTFRGLTHGLLLLDYPVQHVGTRWFVSVPVLVSTAAYAMAMGGAAAAAMVHLPGGAGSRLADVLLVTLGSGIAGLALGVIRERSLSLWPGVVLQWLGWVAALIASAYL
jgi:hypothetical protein